MKVPLWLDTTDIPKYPSLDQNITADICIVGAGITGITLAYLLRDSGLKVVLIDSDKILHGTTAYTTAKLTAQHGIIYHDLIKNFGEYNAQLYANAQREAIEFVASQNIDCDFERKTAYVYTQQVKLIPVLEQEYKAAKQLGFDCDLVVDTELPFPIEKALGYHNQAQFHPLKYLVGLLKVIEPCSNVSIYEDTTATEVDQLDDGRYQIKTQTHVNLNVKKIVQASHFPFYDGLSLLFAKIEGEKSYLAASKQAAQKLSGMYISYEEPSRTLRQYKDYLIIGGENHRVGSPVDTLQKYENIRNFAKEQFQVSEMDYEWSTQDYLTVDKIPFVGSLNHSEIYVATGYQKWGMTNGTAAALLLHDLVLDKKNPRADLFNPYRKNLRAQIRNLVVYNGKVAYELIKGKLMIPDEDIQLAGGESKVIQTAKGKYGVYKDEKGEIYVLDITCPHLGCELNFNRAEATWDCPCHASRFSYKGDVIEGPAHHNLRADKNTVDPNLF